METKEDAIKELFYWQSRRAGSFATSLFETIGRADPINLERFRKGFPEVMEAYDEWFFYPEGSTEFFKKYGFKL